MSEIKAGDTVRILHDDASEADVKAGQCGYVTNVAKRDDGTDVITARVAGRHWLFVEDDLQVLDVADAFSATVAELRDLCNDLNAITDLYDAPEPVDGVPVETTPVIEPAPVVTQADEPSCSCPEDEDDEDEDDEDDCGNCPDSAHYHDEDGDPVVLPSASFVDGDGDKVTATDVSGIAPEASGVAAVVRIVAPRIGGMYLETHLTPAQAVALGEFLINQFAPDAD